MLRFSEESEVKVLKNGHEENFDWIFDRSKVMFRNVEKLKWKKSVCKKKSYVMSHLSDLYLQKAGISSRPFLRRFSDHRKKMKKQRSHRDLNSGYWIQSPMS
ncbi:unnamed protein product [Dovyalis caffra]|uniref:Uncharacterized protein n=1 Tax=Dovyalis caffra TaxID=77055 RepID=A0AAV1SEU5_9ROSI|nr:unnamed protein product [Dovyalis caffra]